MLPSPPHSPQSMSLPTTPSDTTVQAIDFFRNNEASHFGLIEPTLPEEEYDGLEKAAQRRRAKQRLHLHRSESRYA